MRAGQLNRRITIQQNTPTRDSYGGTVDAWSTFATVWAAIEPLTGREYWEASTHNQENPTKFTIRYLSGVTASMRVKDEDDNVFDIQAVIHFRDARREMRLMTKQTNAETA